MEGNSQKLNEGELALYSMQVSASYVPVAVDVASRVFQVCYYDLGAKHVRNYSKKATWSFESYLIKYR